ncbi:serine/threonine-protein kinase RIO1 [Ischnura elegans]|uniref:serine/threonine-protein kinase RIO1 n=1 Tax=Ischnura elegans TaxID=197161 RepID=UPI001ED8A1D7|nr:serine/threonine-protein kinase RIO1 [Ischnura elegans]
MKTNYDVIEGQFSDAEESGVNDDGGPHKVSGIKKLSISGKSHIIKPLPYHEPVEVEEGLYDDAEYDSNEDEDSEEEWEVTRNGISVVKNAQRPNSQSASRKISNYQPTENLLKKYSNKINVDQYEVSSLSSNATNRLIQSDKRAETERIRRKDKGDRATAEQVMDPRTRMILFKLLSRGTILGVNGCISTGKEANVYHAKGGQPDEDIAIKIYKTSILIFKDRDKYVGGEYRFRHGYCKHNPRKMVRTWAEKEMRNLVRMHTAGLPCPKPILLRGHVLLMGFLGTEGWPSPRLKDVELSTSKAREVYRECVVIIWKMYNLCKLVHADLSEFNLLYHEGRAYVIDVSQSVEHDHPNALEFLRKDCTNITEFFRKKDVAVMLVRELFDFVTDPTVTNENMDECLDRLSERAATRPPDDAGVLVDEEVFKNSFIPKRMDEVLHFERDINQAKSGQGERLVYDTIFGLKGDLSSPRMNPEILSESDSEPDEDSNSDDSTSQGEEGGSGKFVNSARPRNESPESKKKRKNAVKAERAEKRKTKMKKHIKKQKEKATKGHHKK